MSFFSCLSCSWLSFPLVRRLDRSVKTQIPKKTAWITCTEGKHTLKHIFIFLCSFSNLFFSWTEKTSPSAEGRSDTGMHEEYCHRTDMGSGNRSVSSIWVEFIHIKATCASKWCIYRGNPCEWKDHSRGGFPPSAQICVTCWERNCSHPFLCHSIQLIPKAIASEAEKWGMLPVRRRKRNRKEYFLPFWQEVSLGDSACPRHST